MICLLPAFFDELDKIAGRQYDPQVEKARQRATYFMSPKARDTRWGYLMNHISSRPFVDQLLKSRRPDAKLKQYVESMHGLTLGMVVGKVDSSSGKGAAYEIKQLPDGRLGCTCGDWQYRGSVTPGYECKHIRDFKERK